MEPESLKYFPDTFGEPRISTPSALSGREATHVLVLTSAAVSLGALRSPVKEQTHVGRGAGPGCAAWVLPQVPELQNPLFLHISPSICPSL